MLCHVEFDFDLMARLARENPAEFARKRAELIEDMINSARNPDEARKMQFEIDMERLRTPPGEKTYLAMAKRMGFLLGQMSNLFTDIHAIASQQKHNWRLQPKRDCTRGPAQSAGR